MKTMRIALLLFLLSLGLLASGGCTHMPPLDQERRNVTIPEEELAAIEKEACARHKLPVVRRDVINENTIVLDMANNSSTGISVFYRKIKGKWLEDCSLQGNWIK